MSEKTTFIRSFVKSLEAACPRVTVRDLPKTASTVEAMTRRQMAAAVSHICFPSLGDNNRHVVEVEGKNYEVRVSEQPDDPGCLGVAIIPRMTGSPAPKLRHQTIQTPSLLRTQRATIHLPHELLGHQDDLTSTMTAVIDAASTWYEGRLISSLHLTEAEAISSLYLYFRSILPSNLQTVPIWFSAANRANGHYVLDPAVAESTLRRLASSADSLTTSPGACVADFLNATVPVEQTFGIKIANQDECVDVNLRDAKYRYNLSNLQMAELAVFGGESASAYPIFSDSHHYLIATFATEWKDSLLPILQNSKDDLAERFVLARSDLDRSFRTLISSGIGETPKYIAEIAGRFLGGWTSTLT